MNAATNLLMMCPPFCAAAFVVRSDNVPFDRLPEHQGKIFQNVRSAATLFRYRLTFTAIGIADLDDMLQYMVDVANYYGAVANFACPSMTSLSLGKNFTSVAISLSNAQKELTE
jgi:hypothetical protein